MAPTGTRVCHTGVVPAIVAPTDARIQRCHMVDRVTKTNTHGYESLKDLCRTRGGDLIPMYEQLNRQTVKGPRQNVARDALIDWCDKYQIRVVCEWCTFSSTDLCVCVCVLFLCGGNIYEIQGR